MTASILTVHAITSDADLDALRVEWDALLDESDQSVYFLRHAWVRAWWRAYSPPRSSLMVITCRDARGDLVGLAPFYRRQHRTLGVRHAREILFLGTGLHLRTSEALDIVARKSTEPAVAEAICGFLEAQVDWDRLWLADVPETSPMLPYLRRGLGPRLSVQPYGRAHHVETRSGWDTFLSSLGKSMRTNVAYYTRRLFRAHTCTFNLAAGPDDFQRAAGALVRLHQELWTSRGEPGAFSRGHFREFLQETMREALEAGRLRLWTLSVDGSIAAVLLGFLDKGVVHYFQGGFDPRFARESLGTVMLGLCIRACIDDPTVIAFDFMGGDASYKESWTRQGTARVELTVERPGLRTLLLGGQHRLKRLAKRVVPAPLWEAVRRIVLQRRA